MGLLFILLILSIAIFIMACSMLRIIFRSCAVPALVKAAGKN